MLPGFRFLFAAIVLSTSILVFGVGAAAILRAAHEEFAASGSWRPAPEASMAQQNETAKPVIAMLQVEPPSAEEKPADAPAVAAPGENSAPPPEPEKTAALDSRPEAAVAEPAVDKVVVASVSPPEDPSAQEAMPAKPDASVQGAIQAIRASISPETKTAAAEPITPAAASAFAAPAPAAVVEPATPHLPAIASAPAEPDSAARKIATLGGPPVAIGTAAPDQSDAMKKEKERARRRRLAAQRARLAAAQQALNPFAPFPFVQPAQTTQFTQPMDAALTH